MLRRVLFWIGRIISEIYIVRRWMVVNCIDSFDCTVFRFPIRTSLRSINSISWLMRKLKLVPSCNSVRPVCRCRKGYSVRKVHKRATANVPKYNQIISYSGRFVRRCHCVLMEWNDMVFCFIWRCSTRRGEHISIISLSIFQYASTKLYAYFQPLYFYRFFIF